MRTIKPVILSLACMLAGCSTTKIPNDAVAFEGHHYAVFRTPLNWDEAKARCETMGGHLACITSEAEQAFVLSQVRQFSYPTYTCCWLGGTDRDQQGNWRWITNEEMTLKGYLLVENPAEHYLNLRLATGQWEDYPVEGEQVGEQWFLCEWDR